MGINFHFKNVTRYGKIELMCIQNLTTLLDIAILIIMLSKRSSSIKFTLLVHTANNGKSNTIYNSYI